MNNIYNLIIRKIHKTLFAVLLGCSFLANAQTPVQKYGQLKIVAGQVSDKNGNPVVLRGMSLFESGFSEGSIFYNPTTVKWLRDDWCIDVVRAAMAVDNPGLQSSYISNAANEQAKIVAVIDACIANGLYVIVDFHTHNAPSYLSQAKTFFSAIATKYGNTPNVLYETYNEPVAQVWSTTIKPYHNAMISTIRAIDPDNIIICGTKTYSQDVDEAANDPVTGTNVAYTLHYYANSHKGELRTKATAAINKGAALFVTEYGTCNASGDGGYNPGESQTWWDYLEANKLSSCNWSVGNKNETSAVLTSGLTAQGGWTARQLSTSGTLVKNYIKGKCNVVVATGTIVLSFAGNKVQYNAKQLVTISAATTVSTGTVARVDFFDGTTLIGSKTGTSPFVDTISTLTSGGHNISARSYDATTGGNLIAVSSITPISIVGASNVTTTGVTDAFETASQFSVLTGGVNAGSCTNADTAATAGVYWYEDKDPTTPFMATATRAGDGTLKYLISQAAGSYNVIGFNFGDYCSAGVKKKYLLDLSGNAVLKITATAPASNTATLDLKMQMKDVNGTVLAINKMILKTDGTVDTTLWYNYEIGFSKKHVAPDFISLAPKTTTNFTFDFKNALTIKNPNNPHFPRDINASNADFDFTKVIEVVMIPVNSVDNGSNGTPKAYAPLAFANQQIIFSGLSLGNTALGPNFCTTPLIPTLAGAAPTYCKGTTAPALSVSGVVGLYFQWYGTSATGGTASTTAPIPSTAAAGTTTYYVSQKAGIGTCEGPRLAVPVTVAEAPTANAGISQTAATGPSVSLSGTGSATGTWSLLSGPTGITTSFSPSATSASVTASGLSALGSYTFKYTVPATTACAAVSSDVDVYITTITSINDTYLSGKIQIYPNPVLDNLFINVTKIDGSKSLKVVDMFGKVVFESSNMDNVTVPMTNLSSGLYVLQIQTETGAISKTIIKQ